MRFSQLGRLLCALSVCFALSSRANAETPTSNAVSSIFSDKGDLGLDSVQSEADAQKDSTPFYKSNGVETQYYEGLFKATTNTSKLALLSDDGASVWIDGQQVLGRAGQGQGFDEAGATTFYPLAFTFTESKIYRLKVEYTNTFHRDDTDIDGVSLWAYDGGGSIINPQLTISANKTSVCAGAIESPIHQAVVTVHLTDGTSPLEGQTVSLELNSSSTDYPFALSSESVTTDSSGDATVKLTSSKEINSKATIKGNFMGIVATSGEITSSKAQGALTIDPTSMVADGEGTAHLKIVLSFNGNPVADHQVAWIISNIWGPDEQLVYSADPNYGSSNGYGSVATEDSQTTTAGISKGTYTVGTSAGIIEFELLDYSEVQSGNAPMSGSAPSPKGVSRGASTATAKPVGFTLRTTAKKWSVQEISTSGTQSIYSYGSTIYQAYYDAAGLLHKTLHDQPIANPKNSTFSENFTLMSFPSGGAWGVDTTGLKWQAKWKITSGSTTKKQGKVTGTGDYGSLSVSTNNTVGHYTLTHTFSIKQKNSAVNWSGSLVEDSTLFTTYQAPFLCAASDFSYDHLLRVTSMVQGANNLDRVGSLSVPRRIQKGLSVPSGAPYAGGYHQGTDYTDAQRWYLVMGQEVPGYQGADCDDWASAHGLACKLLGIEATTLYIERVQNGKIHYFIMLPHHTGNGWNFHGVDSVSGGYCYSITQSTQPAAPWSQMNANPPDPNRKVIYKFTRWGS